MACFHRDLILALGAAIKFYRKMNSARFLCFFFSWMISMEPTLVLIAHSGLIGMKKAGPKAALFPVVPAVPLDRRSRAAARQSQLTTAGSQSDLWWLGCDCPLRVWADRAQLQLCSVNPGEA